MIKDLDILEEVRKVANSYKDRSPQCTCCFDITNSLRECNRLICEARKAGMMTHCCNRTCHKDNFTL